MPKILGGQPPGKIGNADITLYLFDAGFIYSSIAQSVERMTVNHDVTGSSPVGGAKRKQSSNSYSVFVYPIESNWARRRVF